MACRVAVQCCCCCCCCHCHSAVTECLNIYGWHTTILTIYYINILTDSEWQCYQNSKVSICVPVPVDVYGSHSVWQEKDTANIGDFSLPLCVCVCVFVLGRSSLCEFESHPLTPITVICRFSTSNNNSTEHHHHHHAHTPANITTKCKFNFALIISRFGNNMHTMAIAWKRDLNERASYSLRSALLSLLLYLVSTRRYPFAIYLRTEVFGASFSFGLVSVWHLINFHNLNNNFARCVCVRLLAPAHAHAAVYVCVIQMPICTRVVYYIHWFALLGFGWLCVWIWKSFYPFVVGTFNISFRSNFSTRKEFSIPSSYW